MKQKIVIKVSMHCDKCRTKALKIAAAADGVISVELQGPEKDKLMIVGDGIDAACLTWYLRKKLSHASLEMVEEVKDKKVEEKKDAGEKDGEKKEPKSPTTLVVCCPQPQLEYFAVVTEPNPGPCTIFSNSTGLILSGAETPADFYVHLFHLKYSP
ncbi:Heavy metal transport/detoxification superfamily protein, putative [Theobroma cacao]|uniref:Heavy metal transport/detoxification superfamily protein, putative n=1 Tax=Theobroma cacao TaxID=3641 RepID=A0A061FC99_THECC|nr:Heavy metal transport/detoxification superfamily protein, putative [Theobroma cacao]